MAYPARTASAEILTTLAVLKVHEGQGQDFLQNFLPFVAECLHLGAKDSNVVTATVLQAGLKRSFGFEVPMGVVQTLLRRAEKLGLVRQNERVYEPVREVLAKYSIERDRELAGAELDQLTLNFQAFALGEFGVDFTLERAETALFEFIAEHGVFTLPDVQPAAAIGAEVEDSSTHYLVGAFVEHLSLTDAQGFSYFERAVQGSMLASVLHFERKVSVVEQWKSAKVYLDTPIILRLLGLYGDELAAPYLELIKLLAAQGVPVHCFHQTLSEVNGVLYALEEELRRGRRKFRYTEELGEVLLAAGKTAADIKLERGRVERKLLALGITAHEYPRAQAHLTPDYNRVEEVFQRVVSYQNDNARTHDVEAVLAMHRLRSGTRPTQIERSGALFVTTNAGVVRAAREVYQTEFNYRPHDVSGCVLADVLTTIVWLKSQAQLGARDELPRKQLIADAYAAMKPTPSLWAAYLGEIQRLRNDNFISEEDVMYLRCAHEAATSLTRTTLNNASSFTEGTVEQVMALARAATRRDAELAQERAEDEAHKVAQLLAEKEAQLQQQAQLTAAETLGRLSAETQAAHQQAEIARKDQALNQTNVQLDKQRRLAGRVGQAAGWAAFLMFSALAVWPTWKYGLAPSMPPTLQQLRIPFTVRSLPLDGLVPFALFVVLTLFGLVGPAQQLRQWVAEKVAANVKRGLLGNLG